VIGQPRCHLVLSSSRCGTLTQGKPFWPTALIQVPSFPLSTYYLLLSNFASHTSFSQFPSIAHLKKRDQPITSHPFLGIPPAPQQSSVTGQPGGVHGMVLRRNVTLGKEGMTRVHGLNLRHVIVAEVAVQDVRSRLVEAGDVGGVGDGVLLGEDPQRQRGDEAERLPPLVAHQAHGALLHHLVQRGQVVVLPVLQVQEVVLQVGLQLAPLLAHIGEVDEEARAHVALQQLHLGVGGRAETPHQQVAVLQQAAASDLLGAPGADEALAQVTEGGAEVAVDALAENGGVEGGGHGVLRALVEEEQRVQADLEGVHAELKLAPEGVHELELDVLATVVGEGDETPAVGGVAHFHHLLHVRLLKHTQVEH